MVKLKLTDKQRVLIMSKGIKSSPGYLSSPYSDEGRFLDIETALFEAWEEQSWEDCEVTKGCLTIYRVHLTVCPEFNQILDEDIEELNFRFKYPERLSLDYVESAPFTLDDYELVEDAAPSEPLEKHKGLPVEVYNETPIPSGDDLLAAVRSFCDGV